MTLEVEAAKTNIPLIDHQHAKYFEAAEKVLAQCRKTEPDMDVFDEVLLQTHEYAVDNFDTEEYLMELENYPDTAEHIAKHEQFKDRLDALTNRFKTEKVDLREMAKSLRSLLVAWFNNQIRDDDMRLAAFLHKREKTTSK